MIRKSSLSWTQIARLGLVQMALGAIVVLTTSTLNRLMVVELALPAVLPGLLVALHYGIQITRPSWGFVSDQGGRRTIWIIAGMATLATGGIGAAIGVVVLEASFAFGLVISILSYALIGLGVGASGTSLLALLATATEPRRRAAAATITWLMMIAGIALTAGFAGAFLDPYSPERLLQVVSVIGGGAVALTILAVWGIEARVAVRPTPEPMPFFEGLAEIWAEGQARQFTIFVFLSMTAYFMQELILEPFAGLVWGFTPGMSTQLSGAQNGGVFLGMLTVGVAATGLGIGSLRGWVVAGCLGSAAALLALAIGAAGRARHDRAGVLQRDVRRRRNRLDDGLGRSGSRGPRGHAHGPLGCCAGNRGGVRRSARRRGGRCDAAGLRRRRGVRHRVCRRSRAVRTGGSDGGARGRTPSPPGCGGIGGGLAASGARRRLGASSPRAPSCGARGPDRRKDQDYQVRDRMAMMFDVIVMGGGPSGATAAEDLARGGKRVALLDRAGRIKPCGGAIPPRLIADFDVPDSQIVARITTARMISPTGRQVDIPIEGGFVGMVDRGPFDEFLGRVRRRPAPSVSPARSSALNMTTMALPSSGATRQARVSGRAAGSSSAPTARGRRWRGRRSPGETGFLTSSPTTR